MNDMTGLGLAPCKTEGTSNYYSEPDVVWVSHEKEFDDYFNSQYKHWIYTPIKSIVRKHVKRFWHKALYTSATEE